MSAAHPLARGIATTLALAMGCAAPALAQPPLGPPPMTLLAAPRADPVRSQRPIEPLVGVTAARFQRAQDLRQSGLVERARDTLLSLQREKPHHAAIVTELVRVHVQRGDWPAAERLAMSERTLLRDSLLCARELQLTYERLGRPRDALRVIAEAWSASALEVGWAMPSYMHFAALAPKEATALMDVAALARPTRTDLAAGRARVLAVLRRPADAAKALNTAEADHENSPLRLGFVEGSLATGMTSDSLAALETLLEVASDAKANVLTRVGAANRLWTLAIARGREAETAPRLVSALRGVPAERWGGSLLLGLTRTLRESGRMTEARALLESSPGLAGRVPELALEQALGVLRDGPPARALSALDSLAGSWPAARFSFAEALFFAGQLDSAKANYERVAADPGDPDAAVALERIYLLEEQPGSPLLSSFARLAWERWRGRRPAATAIADSLWKLTAPKGPFAARAGLELAELKLQAGDVRDALAPLLVIADSLAGDRLAPVARQRAGDAYVALGDHSRAVAQYEECLARYPRAWNAPEVRRRLENLRRVRI